MLEQEDVWEIEKFLGMMTLKVKKNIDLEAS